MGLVHAAENRLESAQAAFRDALALTPDDWEVHANFGDVLARGGQPGGAIACFERCIAIEPGLPPCTCV
jgi:Tfp pilus assembly protein PilF